ncbi:alpha/beta fold hydrolase [Paracoccus aerodenitrificans]|uniref:alpha/beta fold hydrolase n=1 Tax=Paracoccus aerodenitrificans TaxID=3017781 RepID=UPI0022F0851C|nr:alpha/beta fold hydrolase [Paracoccus aerodenitrificans]WBU64067.1 alpha/beta fold hydrolase [Paracoccus aerodenitrificans]
MKPAMLAAITALSLATTGHAETVTVDGHEVYYEVHGELASDQIPVLLLHGGMMTIGSNFAGLIPALSEDRTVIGVEQQGHGHTPLNDNPITLETMRSDTLAVLDVLEVDRAHVIGFSMGGMLGLELAVNAPERVASLTAISASQNGEGMLPDLVQMNRDPTHQPSPEVAALLPSEEAFSQMAADIAEMNPGGAEAFEQTMQKTGALIASDWGWSDEELAAIQVPVQIVLGDTDFVTVDHALHMKETIPDAWLAVLPDTTHTNIMAREELPGLLTRRIETPQRH